MEYFQNFSYVVRFDYCIICKVILIATVKFDTCNLSVNKWQNVKNIGIEREIVRNREIQQEVSKCFAYSFLRFRKEIFCWIWSFWILLNKETNQTSWRNGPFKPIWLDFAFQEFYFKFDFEILFFFKTKLKKWRRHWPCKPDKRCNNLFDSGWFLS